MRELLGGEWFFDPRHVTSLESPPRSARRARPDAYYTLFAKLMKHSRHTLAGQKDDRMSDGIELMGSRRDYAAAHAAHYSARNLAGALHLYRELIASRPNAPEAGYSRTQIRNIVNAVVPVQELLDAQVEQALAQLGRREPTSDEDSSHRRAQS